MNQISVSQAAKILGVSRSRVHQYIAEGRLGTKRVGQSFVLNERDVERFKPQRAGRPEGLRP